ncbi:hypothetical protein GCM10017044_00510 [Kordiimonas sediminis]|uniref:ABC transporter n=1 Tax=Kordiimonas sediminis TaxID=1735581 RepID=A0A919E475_9PROT|nr:Gldg family protein [Kordiimonas sediminis]GHF10729.1 hypothetical protein GCM10017044_00510 [Kordiimonas sediminis]
MTQNKSLMSRTPVLIGLATLLFLSVTILADRFTRGINLDLTEDKLYTLSEGTKDMLGTLEDTVTIDFYFSRELATPYAQLLSYGKRVEDLLRSFEGRAGGKILLNVIDPEPFSEEEDDAVAAGIRGIPLGDGSTLYMGIAARNDLDGEGSIPFLSEERETFLEYDLVKMIASLEEEGRRTLALVTSLPMEYGPGGAQAMMSGQPPQPYVIYEQLQEFFDVVTLEQDFTSLPDATDVLLVAQPWQLTDDQLFAIDQYVLKGGRALFFIDPHSEAMNPRASVPAMSTLGPLLPAWGVSVPTDKIIGDVSLAQRISMGGYGPDSVKDYVFWQSITKEFLAAGDIVTVAVDSLNIATPGVIEVAEGATTTVTPLVTSSAVSDLFDSNRAVGMPDPDGLLRDLEPQGKTNIIAARIQGQAGTAFPDRVAEISGPVENPGVSDGDINIVLMADTDIFDDRFWVQVQNFLGQRITVPLAGNGSFILNLADHISGSEALLDLRGRGVSKRPFTVVGDLRREAEARFLAEEQRLQDQMATTESRLAELEAQMGDDAAIVTPETEAEIERFREELLKTRKSLREVKRSLRQEIESLGTNLAIINIALVPFLIILIALGRSFIRRRTR